MNNHEQLKNILEIGLSDPYSLENIELVYTLACSQNLVEEFENYIKWSIKANERFLRQNVKGFSIDQYWFNEGYRDINFEYYNIIEKLDKLSELDSHKSTIGISARRGMIAFNCGKHPTQQKENNCVTDKSS